MASSSITRLVDGYMQSVTVYGAPFLPEPPHDMWSTSAGTQAGGCDNQTSDIAWVPELISGVYWTKNRNTRSFCQFQKNASSFRVR